MSEAEPGAVFDLVCGRCTAIAEIWYKAIAHTSFVPQPVPEVRRRLLDLTGKAIDLLFAESLDREAAQAIGAALPQLNYMRPEALNRTIDVLSSQMLECVPFPVRTELQPRLSALLGEIAAGFFCQARDTILADQESIRRALLTERRRAEQALAAARDQALETARVKSDFLATMSHELRTPLNVIIGFTDLTLDQQSGPLNELQRANLERVSRNSRTLLELINGVLDMSKIDAGHMQLASDLVRLNAIAESAVANIETMASAKQLDVTFCPPDSALPLVLGDPGRLQQVVLNLLSNAVKFTPANGAITVILEHGLASELAQAAPPADDLPPGQWVALSVQDTGIGIPPDELERIWIEFYQINSSEIREYGGTGLGLAIAKRLAMLMGGYIGVRSTVGSGSTFTLWMPAA